MKNNNNNMQKNVYVDYWNAWDSRHEGVLKGYV